ncbi:helix-turn-helix domain-containing protein [Tersicoccus sp. MR15.9]|uniref:IclR family transcriptional regulator n=1 Tax=Tersicoccus mangrovi TaxID=3121635 RepID=UPI002FE64F48
MTSPLHEDEAEAPGGQAVPGGRAATGTSSTTGGSHAQTLSRGITMLEILADADAPMSIAEVAAALGVHRSIAYRILRTLEEHSLVVRDDAGKLMSGPGLATLARSVARSLQSASLPMLTELSTDLGLTAFVAVWDHADCVTLVTVEPPARGATIRPGTRHSFSVGAPGIAIQSAISEEQWSAVDPTSPYRSEALRARELGYAVSHDEVIPDVGAIAAPIRRIGQTPAALAVLYLGERDDTAQIGRRLVETANRIEDQLA